MPRTTLRVAVLACLLCASGVTGCYQAYERGVETYAEGQLDQAEEHARKGLEESPDDPALNLLMARVLVDKKEYREAEPYAQAAFDSGEMTGQAGRTLGKIHWELGRPVEAVVAWRAARAAEPDAVGDEDYVRALEAAIAASMSMQRFEESLTLREELAELRPDHEKVGPREFLYNREKLAEHLVGEGQFEEAAELYRELAEAFPAESRFVFETGRLLIKLHRDERAIEAFETYVDAAEDAERKRERMMEVGLRAQRAGANDVAAHFLSQAIEAMGGQPTFGRAKLRLTLAGILFDTEQDKAAKAQIEAYLEDMRELLGLPRSAEVFLTASTTAAEHGQQAYSIELLERALTEAPASWSVASSLAELYARRARTADVETVLKTYVERAEDTAEANLQVARWAQARRNFDLAEFFYEQAVEANDDLPAVWLELARVYSTVGKVDKLKYALETYVKRFDHGRYELLEVASMLIEHRLYEDAEDVLLAARKADPESLVVVDRLASLYTEWGKPKKLHEAYDRWIDRRGANAQDFQLVGERFLRQGDHDDALRYLTKAAERGLTDAWLQIADVYKQQRREVDMKQALDKYLEAAPHRASALRLVLSRYRTSSLVGEEVRILEELIELEPRVMSHYEQLSRRYFEQGREREAFELWMGYLDQSDRPLEALELVARTFERRGHLDWVISLYDRMLDEPDADPRLYRLMGDAYLSMTRQPPHLRRQQAIVDDPVERAEHYYERYLDEADPSGLELRKFADSLVDNRMWPLAARVLSELLEAGGEAEGSEALFAYGQVQLNLGDIDQATTYFKRYFDERGESAEEARVIADVLVEADQFDAAMPYLQHMFASDKPNYVQAGFVKLAEVYAHSDRTDEIDGLIAGYLDRAQNPTAARQIILNILETYGLYAEAAEQIERLRDFQGEVMGFRLGTNLFRAGAFDDAREAFRDYATTSPYPGDAWLQVAEFYVQHGRAERAQAAFDQSVDAAPDNFKALQGRGQYRLLTGDVDGGLADFAKARQSIAADQREALFKSQVETLLRVGRFVQALELSQEALKTAGQHKDFFLRQVVDHELSTSDAARAQRVVDDLRKSGLALQTIVEMLQQHGYTGRAAELIEHELVSGDQQAAAQVLVSSPEVLGQDGGLERIEKAIRPMLDGQRDTSGFIGGQFGELLIQQGHYAKGIEYLRPAVERGGDRYRPMLAHAYAMLGYEDEAHRIFQEHLSGLDQPTREELETIGARYELMGELDIYERLLRLLAHDQRYARYATPLLVEVLARQGRLAAALDVIESIGVQVEPAGEADAAPEADVGEMVDAFVVSLEALAGAGYVAEARALIARLPAEVRDQRGLKMLELKLAALASPDEAATLARRLVEGLSDAQNDVGERLEIARLMSVHGFDAVAAEIAEPATDSPDFAARQQAHNLLMGNAFAAGRIDEVHERSRAVVAEAQDKLATRQATAERLRELGQDAQALAMARRTAKRQPTTTNVENAMLAAQFAGDAEAVSEQVDLMMRVGGDPLGVVENYYRAYHPQQEARLSQAMLAGIKPVRSADLELRLAEASVALRHGEVERGREILLDYLQEVGFEPRAVEHVVSQLVVDGRHVEAARVVAKDLDRQSLTPRTLLMLGLANEKIGFGDQATADFEAYVARMPDDAVAMERIAAWLIDAELYRPAHAWADKAIEARPGWALPRFSRGLARLVIGEQEAAKEDIDAALEPSMRRIILRYQAGVAALKAGHEALGREYLTAVAETPGYSDPTIALGYALSGFVDAERADLGVKFLEERYPSVATGRGLTSRQMTPNLSTIYEEVGQHERAYDVYRDHIHELMVSEPTGRSLPVFLNNLAYTYSTTDAHLDEGLSLVRRAMAYGAGRSPSYIDTLGWLYYRKGDLAAAEAEVRRALRSAGGQRAELAELIGHLAELRAARGDEAGAFWLRFYKEAVER